jgi:hypothetical protein
VTIVSLHIEEFLRENPGMALAPSRTSDTVLAGEFYFNRTYRGENEIAETYELRISVGHNFPKDPPVIEETEQRIKRIGDYHVNQDGSLCLGSPLRLRFLLAKAPTLSAFVDCCLVPYLYAVTYKMRHGGKLIFGELDHGDKGEIQDYEEMFCLQGKESVIRALKALGTKKRISNKRPCPCGCGVRLGKCKTHLVLNQFRPMVSRSYFRKCHQSLKT